VFNSLNLTWSLNSDKIVSILDILDKFLRERTCTLSDIQTLHGKLSDIAQASNFMKGFRFNLLELLKKFEGDTKSRKFVPATLKRDLHIWKNFVKNTALGLPLGQTFEKPLLFPISFVTDAAGACWKMSDKGRINTTLSGDRGAAAVEHDKMTLCPCQSLDGRTA
jgi:hypothetical protein